MRWRNGKFKLIMVCLLTATLILGLYGIAQANLYTYFGSGSISIQGNNNASGTIEGQLPSGVCVKTNTDAQVSGSGDVKNGESKADGQANLKVKIEAKGEGEQENPVVPGPYFGTIKGQVREDTGMLPVIKPIGNALVTAWRIGQAGGTVEELRLENGKILPQPVPPQSVRWTVTDKEGLYKLADLPPGIYLMGCFADWYRPAYARVEVKAGVGSYQDFILKGSFGALGGQVTQYGYNNPVPGATVLALSKDKANEVKHIIKFKKGVPIEDLTTDKLAITPQQKEALAKAAVYKTKTDLNGYYFIPFVKSGEYWVIAIKDNMYACQETKVVPREMSEVNLSLSLPVYPAKKADLQGEANLQREVKIKAKGTNANGNGNANLQGKAEVKPGNGKLTLDAKTSGNVNVKQKELELIQSYLEH